MKEDHMFSRPDLTGETLGGVVLDKKIGSGGFGDVYISPDHKICVKVIFRIAFSSWFSYERELTAVQCISSALKGHCGIVKFFGGGRMNYLEPFGPFAIDPTPNFDKYKKFFVLTEFMEEDCREWREKHPRDSEFFFYLMLAADNLDKEPDYCPDTLENRCRRGILGKMSADEKIQVVAEIIDSLLFLYRLEVREEPDRFRLCREPSRRGRIFHIAHGDIKPGNIFFVNGHAQLGDMGASLQIDPEMPPQIGTPMFMPPEFRQEELREKCGDDYFACSVFFDLIALAKTAQYMLLNGDGEEMPGFFEDPGSVLLADIASVLYSFDSEASPDNVVEKLAGFRRAHLPRANHFRRHSYYGTTAPDIQVEDLHEFGSMWQIVEAESPDRFRVTNKATQWRQYPDILLAERYPAGAEAEIRERESGMLARNENDGLPLLIYQLKKSWKIIVLSHSTAPFTSSEEALRKLRDEIG